MRACVEKVDVLGWNKSIVSRCAEASFVLIRDDWEELVGGVGVFTYMGRPLEKSGKDWPAVRRNIRKVQQVWGRLGKLLRMEGGTLLCQIYFTDRWSRLLCSSGPKHWFSWQQ